MAGDTALPAKVPEGDARQVPGRCRQAGLLYRSESTDRLRAQPFFRKAPGGLFCALKIHIKSIFAASLVFLPDTVSPPLGHS